MCASVVDALSSRRDVEVDRGGKTYAMRFRRGEPGVYAGAGAAGGPDAAFTAYETGSELRVVGKAARGVTGSRVRFWPDRQIFLKDAALDLDSLRDRARQTSFLVPGLTLVVRDERAATTAHSGPTEEVFQHLGGMAITTVPQTLFDLAAVLPVYGLQLLLTRFFEMPSEHPIVTFATINRLNNATDNEHIADFRITTPDPQD